MPDSKISALPAATSVNGRDMLLVVKRSGNNTFTNKKIEGDSFFANISSNTVVHADLTVTGNTHLQQVEASKITSPVIETSNLKVSSNGIIITTPFTPGSSNIGDNVFSVGKFSFDANYIYVKVSANTIKRVALSSF